MAKIKPLPMSESTFIADWENTWTHKNHGDQYNAAEVYKQLKIFWKKAQENGYIRPRFNNGGNTRFGHITATDSVRGVQVCFMIDAIAYEPHTTQYEGIVLVRRSNKYVQRQIVVNDWRRAQKGLSMTGHLATFEDVMKATFDLASKSKGDPPASKAEAKPFNTSEYEETFSQETFDEFRRKEYGKGPTTWQRRNITILAARVDGFCSINERGTVNRENLEEVKENVYILLQGEDREYRQVWLLLKDQDKYIMCKKFGNNLVPQKRGTVIADRLKTGDLTLLDQDFIQRVVAQWKAQ